MQTFLTDRSWAVTARQLDYRRLGKQRVECKQILAALGYVLTSSGSLLPWPAKKGWASHPCTRMWAGYPEALAVYQKVMIEEWIRRGYNNTMFLYSGDPEVFALPAWHDDERVYASHRSNLLRKNPEHYGRFGWTEGPDLPYFYPETN